MGVQDTLFSNEFTLNCKGKILDLSTPVVMGILNLTPDSFHDGGRYNTKEKAQERTEQMLNEGAAIIDIGAASSRPGAREIDEQEEFDRIAPILEHLIEVFPESIYSVDTYRSEVADKAIKMGASIINDISGGSWDEGLLDVIAYHQVPYVLMHSGGKPIDMQVNPVYDHVVTEIGYFFSEKVIEIKEKGIHDIILDPGFGFGKTIDHNYELLNHLDHFKMFECPILAGISRKSMIYKHLSIESDESLNGTTALNMLALERGAKILRVHDVKEAKECIDLFTKVHER